MPYEYQHNTTEEKKNVNKRPLTTKSQTRNEFDAITAVTRAFGNTKRQEKKQIFFSRFNFIDFRFDFVSTLNSHFSSSGIVNEFPIFERSSK